MMKSYYFMVLALITVLYALSCQSKGQDEDEGLQNSQQSARIPVQLVSVDKPDYIEHPPEGPNPNAILYTEGDADIVGIFLGQRPTGGYTISAISAYVESRVLIIEALEESPEPGDMVTQVITYPRMFYTIPAGTTFNDVRLKLIKKDKGK